MVMTKTVAAARRKLRQKRAVRMPLVVYRHRALRESDAFLVAYPKSGSTWLTFMLTFLLTGKEGDHDASDRIVAPVGAHDRAPVLLGDSGRLVRSHEPYAPLYGRAYSRVVYLVRDGRDVAVSYYHHAVREGLFDGPFSPFLEMFLEGKVDGYGRWRDHIESWLASPLLGREQLLVVRYEDLVARTFEELSAVSAFLDIAATPELLREAIERHTVERMRELEARSARHARRQRKDLLHTRKGTPGDWRQTFSPDDQALFSAQCDEVLRKLGYSGENGGPMSPLRR